jgi:hypothetical protein
MDLTHVRCAAVARNPGGLLKLFGGMDCFAEIKKSGGLHS